MNEILGNAGQITNLKLVTIDIKPGGEPNCINLGYEVLIPVAILATPIFDPAIVESSTLSLTSIVTKMKVNSGGGGSIKDVEGDGDLDLVVYFPTVDLLLTEADTAAVLEGLTVDGAPIQGVDPMCVVP